MAAYGDVNFKAIPRYPGRGDEVAVFNAQFTWGGAGVITVDAQKTRGVISVLKGTTGLVNITLPWALRNVSCQATIIDHPASAILTLPMPVLAEGGKVCACTMKTIAGGAAADATSGVVVNVQIVGVRR